MNLTNRLIRHRIIQILWFLFLIAIDQLSKSWALHNLKGQPDIPVIPDVFVFHYLENTGAAFGIFQDRAWLFFVLTGVILAILAVFYVRIQIRLKQYPHNAGDDYRQKTVSHMIFFGYILMALAAGAVGNLIDRIVYGYVVDFLDFRLIHFPVFNFADICVTISCIIIVIFFLFIYKDDDNFRIFRFGNRS